MTRRLLLVLALLAFAPPQVQGNYPSVVSTQVTVTANQTSDEHLSMLQGGTISGRILDPAGKPLSDTQVQILRYGYENGVRIPLRSIPDDSSK